MCTQTKTEGTYARKNRPLIRREDYILLQRYWVSQIFALTNLEEDRPSAAAPETRRGGVAQALAFV